jgi:CO dehydrogenase maturation factor
VKIAVAGKGGVGKTTIAGTLARILARQGRSVLALDADSNPNLALTLGLPPDRAEEVPAVEHGLTEWREDAEGHAYVHLRQPVSQLVADYARAAPDRVQLMVMGEVVEASIGCRCEAHEVARGITGHLVNEADDVILDMEPGLEHLGRGTTEHVDALLIVVEPYYRALMAATRIQELAAQLELPFVGVVGNRVRSDNERAAIGQFCRNHSLELVAIVPFDESVVAAERTGEAPIDHAPEGPAVRAIRYLAAELAARAT